MPLPISLSDMLQRRAAGRSRLAWFREAAMRVGGSIGDLRLRMWGEEGERAYLSVLLDDYVSPVNELRLEALIRGLWPVRSTDLAPSAIKNSAFWAAADRVENEVLLADDFDRADGALGSVPGPGDPVAWQVLDGTVAISGNQLSCSVQAHLTVESGAADCVASSAFPAVNNVHYVAFRIIDVNNMLIAGYETGVNTTLRIYKRDGGAFTALASNAAAFDYSSAEHTISVAMKGDKLRVFVNGVFYLEHTLSAGDYAKYGAATKHGYRLGGGSKADNFSVRTLNPSTDLAAAVDTFSRSTAAEIVDLNDGSRALRLPGTTDNHANTAFTQPSGAVHVYQWDDCDLVTPAGSYHTLGGDLHSGGSGPGVMLYLNGTIGSGGIVYGGDGTTLTTASFTTWDYTIPFDVRVTIDTTTDTWTLERRNAGDSAWIQVMSTSKALNAFAGSATNHRVGRVPYTATNWAKGTIGSYAKTVDGTVVASPDFAAQTAGTTSFADAQGNTWTINQSHGSIGSTETGEAPAIAYSGSSVRLDNGRVRGVSGALTTLNPGLADLDMRADVLSSFRLGWRYIDGSNFLAIVRLAGVLSIRKYDGGVESTLASVSGAGLTFPYSLRVVNVGDRIWVYLGGVLMLTHTLSGADQTKYGAATAVAFWPTAQDGSSETDLKLDNFRVSRPPLVAVWPDLSGKHRHAVQTTTAKQPVLLTNVRNGRPVVRFDGVDDWLKRAFAATLAQPNTFLAAAEYRADGYLMDSASGTARTLFYRASGVTRFSAGVELTSLEASGMHVLAGRANGVTSSFRRDGTILASGDAGAGGMDGVTIGARNTGAANWMNGDVAEFVISDADLEPTGDLWLAEDYLMRRWAI